MLLRVMLIATTGWLFAADVRSETAHLDQHLEWARTRHHDSDPTATGGASYETTINVSDYPYGGASLVNTRRSQTSSLPD